MKHCRQHGDPKHQGITALCSKVGKDTNVGLQVFLIAAVFVV